MKVCKFKSTGRLGETQFGEDTEVLIRNAKMAGFKDEDFEIVDMTREEHAVAIASQNFNDLDYKQKRAREYPDFREFLDGVVKGGLKQIQDIEYLDDIVKEGRAQIQKYIDNCKAVKLKYSKK